MISVCMATYNGERFIKQQITSILSQLESYDELIISDDQSTDNTLNLILSFNDKRIKVLKHVPEITFSRHEKATSNFENALKVAKGDYIFLSDQDDVWMDNKVATCMQAFKDCDFVIHRKRFIDENDRELQKEDYLPLPKNWILHVLNMKWYGWCMAFNKKVLNNIMPFPYKLIGHDYWISAIALRFYKIEIIEEPLIFLSKSHYECFTI